VALSFESLTEQWMAQLDDHANGNEMSKLLVGNKSDLCPPPDDANDNIHDNQQQQQQRQQYTHSREISRDRALEFCARHDMEYLETSAKNGNNVLKSFERLITIVHEKNIAVRGGGGSSGGGGNWEREEARKIIIIWVVVVGGREDMTIPITAMVVVAVEH